MIVWSGRGFLIVVILLGTLILGLKIFPSEYQDYVSVFAAFTSSIFSWYFGKKWNLQNERIVIDEKSGKRLRIKGNNHTLFWVPMQYWGVILYSLGLVILFQNSKLFGTISLILLIVFLIISHLKGKTRLKHQKTFNKKTNGVVNQSQIEIQNDFSEKDKSQIRKEKEDPSRFMPK